MDMSERKGFAKGVEAMRQELITQFERLKYGNFDGAEIVHLIRGVQIKPKDAPKSEPAAAAD